MIFAKNKMCIRDRIEAGNTEVCPLHTYGMNDSSAELYAYDSKFTGDVYKRQ